MWTRTQLKDRAKAALRQNYWKLVLVGVIASVVGSGHNSSVEFNFSEEASPGLLGSLTGLIPAILGAASIGIILGLVIAFFIINPLEVGTKRFFVKSLTEDVQIQEMVYAFDHGYKNVVKILFMRDIKVILWSLLFLIPGIVKGYEYRMVPYLLAENPDLTEEEVFRLSRQMMDGQKLEAFVLDLSFLGWDLLSGLTLGLVGVFYVQPYANLTSAALYDTLSAAHGYPARAGQQWRTEHTYTEYEEI